jgi:hypothetical protein
MEGSVGITVLCPTRGNPRALLEAYNSFHDTAMDRDSQFVAVVDEGDPSLEEYVALIEDTVHLRVDLVPKALTGTMNKALNYAAVRWCERADIVGFIGDDHRFRTPGWDRVILQVLKSEGGGFAYGDDLYQGEKLPTAVFISSPIIRTLGWFAPPAQYHLYLDDAWKRLGDATDSLIYLPDVVIEHMHPAAGKGEWDANHARVNSQVVYDHDREAYAGWIAGSYQADVEKVIGVLAR